MDAKTAVDRVGKGKQRDINARFKAMASHYVFEPEFCNPASGWEKGQVEKNVQDARNRFWQVMPVFADLAELNRWLEVFHAKGVLPARHRSVGRDAAQGLARVHL